MSHTVITEPVAAPTAVTDAPLRVPFFRPDIRAEEIAEVVATLESGWLTTGPRVGKFEEDVCAAVSANHAVAVNSCTAALHLAIEALGLERDQGVLVPTMTFAATAEVVRYLGAVPILVDCVAETGNMDLADAARRLVDARATRGSDFRIVGIMPVHVGGLMMDLDAIRAFARDNGLWVVEDAAHALPAAWRPAPDAPWERCGQGTADVTCFSFYANKTVTTGEGGMAVTSNLALASRMRLMSLHGLSHDAWGRYSGSAKWEYDIIAPGFKYNMTDLAAAIGIHQLARAEHMRARRETIAGRYREALCQVDALALPPDNPDRIHAWHLFALRLHLDRLTIDRHQFIGELRSRGIATAVHWKPLHLHPYYRDTFGFSADAFPVATDLFRRTLSLPLFPTMTDEDIDAVVEAVRDIATRFTA